MDAGVTLRTFLGLPLATAFQGDIAPLIEKLKRDHPEVRWVKASEIHVTLHFFGSIEAEEIPKIKQLVSSVTERSRPLELCLKGVGGFPNLGRPRVVWVGIEGATEPLKALQAAIERELGKAGFPGEAREFKPHLTLGRVKEGGRVSGIDQVFFGATEQKKLSELVLFQSHLSPEGARYERIATFPLSAP